MSGARSLLVSFARAVIRGRMRQLMVLMATLGFVAAASVPVVLAAGSADRSARASALHHGFVGGGRFDMRRLPSLSASAGAALPAGRELVSKRTATSRTFETSDGRYIARIYPWPVNFKDASGQWQPIDDSLVAASGPGSAYRTKSDGDQVELPVALDRGGIRLASAGDSVSMQLDGGRGALHVSGTTADVTGALPGVDATYGVGHGSVKESLKLASASSPATYTYSLDLSRGLSARENAGGGIDVVDRSGNVRFAFVAPFAYDAAGSRIEAGHGISLHLSGAGSKPTATVAVDPAWLRAADRRFPVVIDPTVQAADSQDCYVESGSSANTSFCGGQNLKIGYDGTNAYRSLLQFNVQGVVPAHATVAGTNMEMYLQSETNGANQPNVGAYQVNRSWTTGATWNKYDGTNNWTTPGGDFQSSYTYASHPGPTTGVWNGWSMSALTQGWLDGTIANYGVVIKDTTENQSNVYSYASKAQPSFAPYLQVTYEPGGLGSQQWYPMFTQKLTDRSSLGVNTANGNLVVHSNDLSIAGTGIPFTLQRTFNNLSPDLGSLGYQWTTNSGYDMWLDVHGDAVTFHDPTYTAFRFDKNGTDGSGNQLFKAPPGIHATLIGNASDGSYTLTYNKSGVKLHFGSDADDLLWIQDRNGHQITINNGSGSPDMVSSVLDTQNRTTTFGYHTGPTTPCINQLTDSTTRSESYSYYADGTDNCGMLKTFTDGAGKTTTYGYDNSDDLTQITNPAGDITQIGYDSSHRVTSIKRITNNTTMAGDTTNFVYFSGYTIIEDPLYSGGTPTPGAAHTTTLYYDSQGHRTKVVDGKNNAETTTWSSDNQISTDTSPKNQGGNANQALQNTYDANNNLQEQIAPNTASNGTTTGADTKWSYNPSGAHPFLPDSMTNPSSSQYSFSYDSTNNNLTQVGGGSPSAAQANYDYNHLSYSPQAKCSNTTDTGPIGTVRCSKDGAGNETYYTYDTAGNLTKISPPAGGSPNAPRGTTQIAPDSLSRISTVTDGLNQQTTYKYDGDDRVNEIDYADGTKITYTYDGDGNLTQRFDSSANGGTSNYTYDLKNRLTQRQDPYGTSTYGYDAADDMLSMHDSGGTVSYGYDTANMLCYVYVGSSSNTCDGNDAGAPSGATSFKYDGDGNRISTTYPGNTQVIMNQTYDNADRATDVSATKGGSKFIDFAYTYVVAPNDKDLRQTMTDVSGNKTTYSYDGLDRLQEAATKTSGGTTTFDRTYAYDGASNLCWTYNGSQASPTCSTEPAGGVTTYKYGADNQLCWYLSGTSSNTCGSPPSGAVSFSYDANGMETNDTASSIGGTSSYNARGQYTTWRGVSPEDYIGPDQTERTVNGVDSYQYSALGLGERTHSGAANYYTRDPHGTLINDRTGGSSYNYIFDGLGSVVALTDTNGNVVNSYSYDPQGNTLGTPTENVDNPWRYAAGLWSPSTGTLKYGDRFYDPTIERWTQPEPADENGVRLGNDYLYGGDDPVNAVDSTGLWSVSIELGGYVGVGGSAGVTVGSGGVGVTGSVGAGAGAHIGVYASSSNVETDYGAETRGCLAFCASHFESLRRPGTSSNSYGCCGVEFSPLNIRGTYRLFHF